MDTRTWSVPTSPRSPIKLVGHISLLKEFEGKKWNTETQREYAKRLVDSKDFEGSGSSEEMEFSARDIINRAPKTLGFIRADSTTDVLITSAGKKLIAKDNLEDLFLRQLLKWQYPSAKHDTSIYRERFCIKPFLEVLRLIKELDGLTKIEIAIFAVPLIKYSDYEETKNEIIAFRAGMANLSAVERKRFQIQYHLDKMRKIYAEEIREGRTHLREAGAEGNNEEDYLKTKRRNTIDYADAAIRYFRMTNLFVISTNVYKLSISKDKLKLVEDILKTIPRKPESCEDEGKFLKDFENPELPVLPTDNIEGLKLQVSETVKILRESDKTSAERILKSIEDEKGISALRKILVEAQVLTLRIKQAEQAKSLQSYSQFADIQTVFDQLLSRDVDVSIPDKPLFFEWNVWRALSMLDDGQIDGNLEQDLEGKPVRPALGGFPDIVCYYKDFVLVVEVTLTSGRRQYEAEQEPVSRHVGDVIKSLKEKGDTRRVYGLFLAPVINESSIAHFYTTRKINVSYYGGYVKVIPLSLPSFRRMLEKAHIAGGVKAKNIQAFIETMDQYADTSSNEQDWFNHIESFAQNWLA